MNNIEVYYFSGTGNTIYLLNQMKKRIPQIEAIPVASLKNSKISPKVK